MVQKPAIRKVGLARALSKLGHCSRSQGFTLIHDGRVRLNDRIIRDAEFPVNLWKDRIDVDGERLVQTEKIYLMLNKPHGIVTTASDEKGRETVYSLLPKDLPFLSPVGRLDKASEGVLLLTNDSEWAALITDPITHLDKTYHVQVGDIASEEMLDKMRKGIKVKDGETLRMKRVR
jgi:23S rRNA pseudouridine2605 synthase